MMRETWLPHDPTITPGARPDQTSGEWICREMERGGITNQELYRRMRALGYSGYPNIIPMWRHDSTPIALETLPLVLEALGLPTERRQLWATHFLHAQYPRLAGLLLDAA